MPRKFTLSAKPSREYHRCDTYRANFKCLLSRVSDCERMITAHKYVCLPANGGMSPNENNDGIATKGKCCPNRRRGRILRSANDILCVCYVSYFLCIRTFSFAADFVRSTDRLIDLCHDLYHEESSPEKSYSSTVTRYANEYTTGGFVKGAHEKLRTIQFRVAALTEFYEIARILLQRVRGAKRRIA